MKEKLMVDDLRYHDEMYAKGTPELSDVEYDQRKSCFRECYPINPYNVMVGSSVDGDKVKLPFVLGSLTKVKPDGSCQKWMEQHKGAKVYWAKLDGVSALVEYVNGSYSRALTRGDGEYGQDITEKLRNAVPKELKIPVTGSYRSEVMLVGETYKDLGYKTRRNGVAGILNRDGIGQCEHLVVMFYELVECNGFNHDLSTEMSRIGCMEGLGFGVAPYRFDMDKSSDQLIGLLSEWKEGNGFDIDGVVIALDESEREDTYYPELKVAFKCNEEAVPVKVVGVEWNVGRTGRVVPTILLEPTIIQGVTIERATGFNAKFIVDNNLKPGTIVRLVRSGDCIPYIDSVEWED